MPKENIIWAVDPFTAQKIPLAKSRHMLATLQKCGSLAVEPVAIVSPKDARWPLEFDGRWSERFLEVAEFSLKDVKRKMRLPEVADPKLLVEASVRREDAIRALLNFSSGEAAKIILVNLHAHAGLKRFRLGGFTESLFAASSIPVLTLRGNTRVPNQIKVIAFPTDLTRLAKKYLPKIISIARDFGARLAILHRLEVPAIFSVDWVGFAAAAEMEPMQEVMAENESIKKKLGEEFVAEAHSAGVGAEFHLIRGMTSLGEAIVRASCEAKADIVAVAAQDHSLTQKILGSTSREVLRLSPRPVLVLPGRI
ncbi:MAG: universal stress protein [Bacteriovoracia bacterium]